MNQPFVKQSILALLVLTLGGSYQSANAKATIVKIYCPNPATIGIEKAKKGQWKYTGDFEYHMVSKGTESLFIPVTASVVDSYGAEALYKDPMVHYSAQNPKQVQIECEYDFGNKSAAKMTLSLKHELPTEKLAESCKVTKSNCQSANNLSNLCYVYCSAEDEPEGAHNQ